MAVDLVPQLETNLDDDFLGRGEKRSVLDFLEMKPEELRAYADRDWAAVARAKTSARLEEYRRTGPAGSIRIVDRLQQEARALHPEWPTAAARRADLDHHARLSARLGRVRLDDHR